MLHVVLYQPEIPQNTGNIGRTCVALGAKLWLIEPLGFRLDESRLRRAGLDYWPHLDWCQVPDWETLRGQLSGRTWWLLTKLADREYTQAAFADEDVLVFGGESRGLPPSLHQQHPESRLRIPMSAAVRSLNLATSVGIVAYEARRQIELAGGGSN